MMFGFPWGGENHTCVMRGLPGAKLHTWYCNAPFPQWGPGAPDVQESL